MRYFSYNIGENFTNIILKKILSLPQTDRGIEGLVYLNKVYEKYIWIGLFCDIKPNE